MLFPVFIELRRPVLLPAFLVLIHATAVACVIVLPWALFLRFALLALLGFSLWRTLMVSPVVGLCLVSSDKISCLMREGGRLSAIVLPGSTVFSHFIVLRLEIEGKRQAINLTLLPDQMSSEAFRTVRLWLRWRSEPKKDAEMFS